MACTGKARRELNEEAYISVLETPDCDNVFVDHKNLVGEKGFGNEYHGKGTALVTNNSLLARL